MEMCRNHTCPSGYVKDTLTKKCLPETIVCDGRDSYENGVDCETFNCPEGYVKCADMKTCVKVGYSWRVSHLKTVRLSRESHSRLLQQVQCGCGQGCSYRG